MFIVANRRTRAWAPVTQFFDVQQFLNDLAVIADSARGRALSVVQVVLAMLRHFDQRKAPPGFTLTELLKILNAKTNGALMGGRKPPPAEWKMLWVGGMWFQDLWTYDFRRTEMCVIPYAHSGGRDLVLRLQHRGGLAADDGEHAHGGQHQGLVPAARPAQDLRRRPADGPAEPVPAGSERPRGRRGRRPRLWLRRALTTGRVPRNTMGRHLTVPPHRS